MERDETRCTDSRRGVDGGVGHAVTIAGGWSSEFRVYKSQGTRKTTDMKKSPPDTLTLYKRGLGYSFRRRFVALSPQFEFEAQLVSPNVIWAFFKLVVWFLGLCFIKIGVQ